MESVHTISNNNWLDHMKEKIVDSQLWLTEGILWGGCAFVLGFLLKNFGKQVIGVLFIMALTVILLQYGGMLSVSFEQLLHRIGIPVFHSFKELTNFGSMTIQNHIVGVLAALIGFALGWKLG